MKTSIAALVVVALAAGSAQAERTFTVKNSCEKTIWPALFTSVGTAPGQKTGWEAKAGSSVSFQVDDTWNGRIWARTDCDFSSGSTLPSTCLTGGCNGGLVCATVGGTGVAPASLAEWNLNASEDWLDVSLVDGFNLPISITNDVGCDEPTCTADLNTNCPAELSVSNSAGDVVGCNTACGANLDGTPANSKNCCSGEYDTPEKCPSSGVQVYDEASGSALFTCPHDKSANYVVTFCP
ncbi:hypothetical protein JCM8097_008936 [Rhodosporidiobolus ruineniae]